MSNHQSDEAVPGYWDRAGEQGYGAAMYTSGAVEAHVRGRLWRMVIEIADRLGVPTDGQVLDLGCGDGALSNQVLAPRFRSVHGIDVSHAAIRRAKAEAAGDHVTFRAADLTTFDLDTLPRYDAVFLFGILHHIKGAAPGVVQALRRRTDRLIILEPNGNHLVRKLLELTPTYRSAGEDSFRKKTLMAILRAAGWQIEYFNRVNIFPNFAPDAIFRLLLPIEPLIEKNRLLNRVCTADLYGLSSSKL